MSDQLNKEEEDLLQSALSSAFEPPPLPQVSAVPPPPPPKDESPSPAAAPLATTEQESTPTAPVSSTASSIEDSWKADYEVQVSKWREESAEQRVKSEVERKKWEEVREKEEKEGKGRGNLDMSGSVVGSGWERLSVSGSGVLPEKPSVADARDLVSGEGQGGKSKETLESILPGEPSSLPAVPSHDRLDSEADSSKHEKWEDVPSSLTSSYPSMSFPSDPQSPSSSHQPQLDAHHPQHDHAHHHHHEHKHAAGTSGATLAIFDSSLSKKTRVLALLSSLAINLLLPFVNGVMLGVGEIFARNIVVGWFGWKRPGGVAATTGIGAGTTRSRRT